MGNNICRNPEMYGHKNLTLPTITSGTSSEDLLDPDPEAEVENPEPPKSPLLPRVQLPCNPLFYSFSIHHKNNRGDVKKGQFMDSSEGGDHDAGSGSYGWKVSNRSSSSSSSSYDSNEEEDPYLPGNNQKLQPRRSIKLFSLMGNIAKARTLINGINANFSQDLILNKFLKFNSMEISQSLTKAFDDSVKIQERPSVFKRKIKIEISQFRKEQKNKSIGDYYNLIEAVGKGAFATVYKATHLVSGDIRAVKVIQKSLAPNSKSTLTAIAEFDILKKLDHPNILKLHEYFQDARNIYIVMEYCEGGPLYDQLLKCKQLTEQSVAKVMQQILSAVAYCHERNVVHRDLKPANILLINNLDDICVKIIDFGGSKIIGEEGLKDKFGTPIYIAPEVITRQHYNEKCDLWSSGVIMYSLLCGRPPFEGGSTKEILHKVVDGVYSFRGSEWSIISKGARCFIEKLLHYEPDKRISAREALDDLWLIKQCTALNIIPTEAALLTYNNLLQFSAKQRLQEAVLTYLVCHVQNNEEEKRLKKIFEAFDTNKDGALSREELIDGYFTLFGDFRMAEVEVERIMKKVDVNENGRIDYSEFLMATSNVNNLLGSKKLQMAFEQFDLDGNGVISVDELHKVLGGDDKTVDKQYWMSIIKEVDKDNDGCIDFSEFKAMMNMMANRRFSYA